MTAFTHWGKSDVQQDAEIQYFDCNCKFNTFKCTFYSDLEPGGKGSAVLSEYLGLQQEMGDGSGRGGICEDVIQIASVLLGRVSSQLLAWRHLLLSGELRVEPTAEFACLYTKRRPHTASLKAYWY